MDWKRDALRWCMILPAVLLALLNGVIVFLTAGVAQILSVSALCLALLLDGILLVFVCRCQRDVPQLVQDILAGMQKDAGDSRRGRASEEQLAQQMLRTQAEIAALQNQINPHFLYNTLETIRGKALLHDEEELAEMIEVLARLFRYNISRHEECAALAEELENVRDCVQIYNYRFDGRFQLIEQYEDMDEEPEQYLLPVLTLQPFVENAIRHGLEPKMGVGTLLIRIFRTQSNLMIQIQDDGIGMEEAALMELRSRLRKPDAPYRKSGSAQSSGIALVNVHQRIQLMFGPRYGVGVISSPDWGTRVELALPADLPETVRQGGSR